ncbi:MAG TPA: hypothetical protein VHE30_03145 [Polyangiaceae bacterium]|nr:hypothetical protein [Polyangiaceae bacterium]
MESSEHPSPFTSPRARASSDEEERRVSPAVDVVAGEELREAVQDVAGSLEQLYRLVGTYVSRKANDRPYAVLGVAAGAGFVLGGGLASHLTRVLLSQAGRLALISGARSMADSTDRRRDFTRTSNNERSSS